MKLTDNQKNQVKVILQKIESNDDLLALLNAIKVIIDELKEGEPFQPIKLNALTFFADYYKSGSVRYYEFTIKKKNGGERSISAPTFDLKVIQQCIAEVLSAVYEPKYYVTGFIAKRNVVDNATMHVGKQFVYNIDLKDFFPSIHLHRVKAILKLEPFNLTGDREPLAFLIARLCCITKPDNTGSLPQGAPTSPIISNIICQQLDRRLNGLAKRFRATYSRYADDITFSADANIFHGTFEKEMRRIIAGQNFIINQAKVRLQGKGYRQEVTGLIVNDKVNVCKRYIRDIRAMLHNWQKMGYEQAETVFRQHYVLDRGHIKNPAPILRNVLHGKLNYLKMVRGGDDLIYQRYSNQFKVLTGQPQEDAIAKLVNLLSLWESGGIDAAIKHGKI